MTGTASDNLGLANVEIYDGSEDLGRAVLDRTTNGWTADLNLSPGLHHLSAIATNVSGQSSVVQSPYELITGINDQRYTDQEIDLDGNGMAVRVSDYDANGNLISQSTDAGGVASMANSPKSAFDPTAAFVGGTAATLTGTVTRSADVEQLEIYDGPSAQVFDGATGKVLTGATALGAATLAGDGSWFFQAHLPPGEHQFTAVTTNTAGVSTAVQSSYQLVTGINNEPYVYQEQDFNARGTIVRTTDYSAGGEVVAQGTDVGNNGPATAVPKIAFDSTATFESASSAALSGTVSQFGGVAQVEIFDGPESQVFDTTTGQVLAGVTALGSAALSSGGVWTFDAHVSPGTHEFTAVVTNLAGVSTAVQSTFELVTGIGGQTFVYQEIDHSGAGAAIATTSYAADGSVVSHNVSDGVNEIAGTDRGQVLRSVGDDVMTGVGGNTTFLFKQSFGRDEIGDFNVAGPTHDYISLPHSDFVSLAAVFHHTTTALDGSAVIHLDKNDSIKVDGVTKAQLIANTGDFRFHP